MNDSIKRRDDEVVEEAKVRCKRKSYGQVQRRVTLARSNKDLREVVCVLLETVRKQLATLPWVEQSTLIRSTSLLPFPLLFIFSLASPTRFALPVISFCRLSFSKLPFLCSSHYRTTRMPSTLEKDKTELTVFPALTKVAQLCQ